MEHQKFFSNSLMEDQCIPNVGSLMIYPLVRCRFVVVDFPLDTSNLEMSRRERRQKDGKLANGGVVGASTCAEPHCGLRALEKTNTIQDHDAHSQGFLVWMVDG